MKIAFTEKEELILKTMKQLAEQISNAEDMIKAAKEQAFEFVSNSDGEDVQQLMADSRQYKKLFDAALKDEKFEEGMRLFEQTYHDLMG